MALGVAFAVSGMARAEGPADAQIPDTFAVTDPEVVAGILQADGYRAKIVEGDSGPVIESAAFGIDFFIQFHGCGGRGTFCTGLLFLSGFDLEQGASQDLMAEWNAYRLVGRAFLDEVCDPFIDHYVSADPRMSREGWERLMADWLKALNDFSEWVDPEEGEIRPVASCRGDATL
jgi:hypothetical protein